MENKHSYFVIHLKISFIKRNLVDQENLENSVDLILEKIESKEKIYKAYQNKGREIIYLFRANIRKRKNQLVKLCEKHLPEDQQKTLEVTGISKDDFFRRNRTTKKKYRI